MALRFAFILVVVFGLSQKMESREFLGSHKGIFYYFFQKGDPLPDQFVKNAKPMYFKAYDPSLHKEYPLEDMGIDVKFRTYEEFLFQLIEDDFKTYDENTDRTIVFATQQPCQESYENLCGFCVFLPQQAKGEYYLDHIGVKNSDQRRGIGHQLLDLTIRTTAAKVIALDTRVFNVPGENFYKKEEFSIIEPHPVSEKEGKYFRFVKYMR